MTESEILLGKLKEIINSNKSLFELILNTKLLDEIDFFNKSSFVMQSKIFALKHNLTVLLNIYINFKNVEDGLATLTVSNKAEQEKMLGELVGIASAIVGSYKSYKENTEEAKAAQEKVIIIEYNPGHGKPKPTGLFKNLIRNIVFPAPNRFLQMNEEYSPDKSLQEFFEKYPKQNLKSRSFWVLYKDIVENYSKEAKAKKLKKRKLSNDEKKQLYYWLDAQYRQAYSQELNFEERKYHFAANDQGDEKSFDLSGLVISSKNNNAKKEEIQHVFYVMGNAESQESYYAEIYEEITKAEKLDPSISIVAHIINPRGVVKSRGEAEVAADLIDDYTAIVKHAIEREGIPAANVTLKGHSLGAAVATKVTASLHKEGYLGNVFNSSGFLKTSEAINNGNFIRGFFARLANSLISKAGWQIDALSAYQEIPIANKNYLIRKAKGLKNADAVIGYEGSLHYGLKEMVKKEKAIFCKLALEAIEALYEEYKKTPEAMKISFIENDILKYKSRLNEGNLKGLFKEIMTLTNYKLLRFTKGVTEVDENSEFIKTLNLCNSYLSKSIKITLNKDWQTSNFDDFFNCLKLVYFKKFKENKFALDYKGSLPSRNAKIHGRRMHVVYGKTDTDDLQSASDYFVETLKRRRDYLKIAVERDKPDVLPDIFSKPISQLDKQHIAQSQFTQSQDDRARKETERKIDNVIFGHKAR